MVENFIERNDNLNRLRISLGLPEIFVKWHNNYLNEDFIAEITNKDFKLISRKNLSSFYYFITRVVYSKICAEANRKPDYDNIIYKVATEIEEPIGNYGPVNLLVFKKNN